VNGYCVSCLEPSARGARFCEACGRELAAGIRLRTRWELVISSDEAFFQRSEGATGCPVGFADRVIRLDDRPVRIGRRTSSPGRTDDHCSQLSLDDSGVSRAHALLEPADAGWSVTDLGSTNGTYLNGAHERLVPNAPVRIDDGEFVNVGAWTRITMHGSRE